MNSSNQFSAEMTTENLQDRFSFETLVKAAQMRIKKQPPAFWEKVAAYGADCSKIKKAATAKSACEYTATIDPVSVLKTLILLEKEFQGV